MKHTLKKGYITSWGDFLMNGEISPTAVMKIFEDLATIHAEQLGFGWEAMKKRNQVFVLSRQKVIFKKPINQTGEITGITWPTDANGKRIAERNYQIQINNEVSAESISKWCLIDIEKRSICKIEDITAEKLRADSVEVGEFKRVAFDESFKKVFTYTVRNSGIDINQHLNNKRFLEIALDAVELRSIKEFEIIFNKECFLGDEIEVWTNESEVIGKRKDEVVFSVAFLF